MRRSEIKLSSFAKLGYLFGFRAKVKLGKKSILGPVDCVRPSTLISPYEPKFESLKYRPIYHATTIVRFGHYTNNSA